MNAAEGKTPGGSPVPRIIKREGANLPHWRLEGATYAVTFRLADSLPAAVLRRWKAQREAIVARAAASGRAFTRHEHARLAELFDARVQKWLDRGRGSCALREPGIGELVQAALLHFDNERYDLVAWCVMPNHVHAVVRPRPPHELSKVLLSWKGFTGRRALELLGKLGTGAAFWQKESYDHIVRDEADLAHQVRYVLENPARAGLRDWPWCGVRRAALPGRE